MLTVITQLRKVQTEACVCNVCFYLSKVILCYKLTIFVPLSFCRQSNGTGAIFTTEGYHSGYASGVSWRAAPKTNSQCTSDYSPNGSTIPKGYDQDGPLEGESKEHLPCLNYDVPYHRPLPPNLHYGI